jgi:hypothetical protein
MKTTEENFVRMAQTVQKTLLRHQDLWTKSKPFLTTVGLFRNLLLQLEGNEIHTKTKTNGATKDKGTLGEEAITAGVRLAKIGCSYAEDIENQLLFENLKTCKSALQLDHEASTVAKLRNIHESLTPLIKNLAAYMVTQSDLDAFRETIDNYNEQLSAPRDIVVKRKEHNHNSFYLIGEMRTLLANIDKKVYMFDKYPFFNEYNSARIIVDLGSRHDEASTPLSPSSEDGKATKSNDPALPAT